MNTNTGLAMIIIASLAISACSSTSKETTTQTPPQAVAASNAQGISTTPLTSTDIASNDLATQLLEMQKRSIYFDMAEYAIKPEYHETLLKQAEFMVTHGDVDVTLEAHADERGSSEYNLALGTKRANAVAKSLEKAGVTGNRIKTISFGEERPRLTCHEEQCWKENRRVDFIGKQD